MLLLLHIENIAVIQSADIQFDAGFNVLTGETGAGKSIVVDALNAVLGGRTSRDLIRTGAKSALVSAQFVDLPQLDWFQEQGIAPDAEGVLLLQRELRADGKNTCRLNGRPVSLAQLRELGRQEKPVLLKRSFGATVTELLQAAEYILAGGNERVILCERGIRTFETDSRATLDVAGIAALKEQSHLPVLADPSHAAGRRELVAPLALAAAAAGADGLMIEVHDRPEEALSDGRQALTCGEFARLARRVQALTALLRQEE